MATEVQQTPSVYEQIESYDWDNDQEFQAGLRSITGSASSPEQIEYLTMRARCFYFSRKLGTKIDFDEYLRWRTGSPPSAQSNGLPVPQEVSASSQPMDPETHVSTAAPATSPHGNAPTPASFAEICQLIAEGKPIPGIKEIPDTILEGQATQSTAAKRRKPWEKADPPVETAPAANA